MSRVSKLVFVSTPYASIDCRDKDRNYYAKQIALEACRQVRLNGYDPISPVLAWMDIYSEMERVKVMDLCHELLSMCSYYYYHSCKFSKSSKGMEQEKVWANELGLTELKFSLFD